jgi:hypothetical protein
MIEQELRVWRKQRPVFSGVLRYFPDALLEIANVSFIGNEQHNPGTPLHWDRSKSTDEHDALLRHLIDAGTRDSDGVRHSAKVAWRALAALQKEIEADRAAQEPEEKGLTHEQELIADGRGILKLATGDIGPACKCTRDCLPGTCKRLGVGA